MARPLLERLRADAFPAFRGRALRPLVRHRELQFPTFAPDVHEAMARMQDYFRYATLGLALERVRAERIPGALAELGVWRGVTSAFLHRLAPERTLYLFDTFAGFPDADLPDGARDERFRDTSEAAVRARVGASPNVRLRPGYVPETLAGLEDERFAFVLLDLDLYDPTLASLEFFYPRLSPGGYLVMHDYNNPESDWACKRAFDAFLADKPELVVELGDMWGSALVRRLG
jgi:O-methyltransferase